MSLQLIYHFKSSSSEEGAFVQASYGVVYFFSKDGMIEKELLQEMSKVVPDADHTNLKFLNLDDLKTFALRVAQELSSLEVRLLSVQDYNIGIDGAKDAPTYQSIFQKYGEVLINESQKKSFLKKFFT